MIPLYSKYLYIRLLLLEVMLQCLLECMLLVHPQKPVLSPITDYTYGMYISIVKHILST